MTDTIPEEFQGLNEKDIIECLADIKPEKPEYIWKPYIPKNAITLVQGASCSGKSTLMWHLAARLSKGYLPDGIKGKTRIPKKIIYQDLVDFNYNVTCMNLGWSDVAEDKVVYIDMLKANEAEGKDAYDTTIPSMELFEYAIEKTGADILFIDPVTFLFHYGTDDPDSERAYNEEIIAGLKKIVEMGCTVILTDNSSYDFESEYDNGMEKLPKIATSILYVERPDFGPVSTIEQLLNMYGPLGKSITVKKPGKKFQFSTDIKRHAVAKNRIVTAYLSHKTR